MARVPELHGGALKRSEENLQITGPADRFILKPVLLGISITTVSTIPVFLTGALGVQIRRDLHLNAAELGGAVAIFFAAAAITSISSGKLAQRSGFEVILRVCVLLSVVALGGMGFLANSYLLVLAFLAIGGIANGAAQPAVNLFLSKVVPVSRQGFAFGIKQAAIPVSTFLSGLAVPFIALTIGWHYAYAIIAPVGIILFFMIPKAPRETQRASSSANGKQKIYIAPLVVLAIAMGLGSGAANALGAFLVSSSVHAGWAPGAAGFLVVLGSAIGISSRLLNGYLADRRIGRHLAVTAWMVGTGGIGYLLLTLGYAWLVVPATIISYGAGWGWNGLFNFAVVWSYPRAAGHATGITQSGAYFGSVLGPLVFGFIVDHSGYSLAWSSAALEAFLAGTAMVVARKMMIAGSARLQSGTS
ncbi:MAG: MFS transporter [Actinomycetota bacterium]|nr:MAG: MFS transporter [Actinomycetota bacterium]